MPDAFGIATRALRHLAGAPITRTLEFEPTSWGSPVHATRTRPRYRSGLSSVYSKLSGWFSGRNATSVIRTCGGCW